MKIASALAIVLGVTATGFAYAQTEALPLWELGVFVGAASTAAYPGSGDRALHTIVVPTVVYRGKFFRAEEGNVGARFVVSEDVELDVGFAGSLPANSDNVSARKGMPDLGTLLEFGPRLKMTLARPGPGRKLVFELPVRAVLEVNGGLRQRGYAIEPELGYEVRDVGDGWSLSAITSLVFGDANVNQYLYGVSAPYVTNTRPAYAAQAGLIAARVGLSTVKSLTPDLRVFGYLRHDLLEGVANKASPLFQRSSGTSLGIGLSWTFSRSTAKAFEVQSE